ncbi:hypothetical protein HDF26_003446 [Pedobacter cryoconitis]|uniref:DUF7710 domain-containing protein n=1 Tax=Pedobacter cryoconitis TaxID=188932 RepID=UPI001619C96A|nr:hypothetical protein [Pedobacter cryoconitis]MBB6272986.1 hypothetical protein [Pedobacter cryoconitis]
MSDKVNFVWVFHGAKGRFSGGVFSSLEKGEVWVKKHELTGVLTKYPLDEGAYDWAVQNDFFEIKREDQKEPLFIGNFTSASQEHYHFEDGEKD